MENRMSIPPMDYNTTQSEAPFNRRIKESEIPDACLSLFKKWKDEGFKVSSTKPNEFSVSDAPKRLRECILKNFGLREDVNNWPAGIRPSER